MQIDWWTFGFQVLNFLILVWLMWRCLFKPVRKVVQERKKLAQQAFADADEEKKKAEAAQQELEEHLAGQADERQALMASTHQQLEKERADLMETTRREARKLIDAARNSIEKERRNAIVELRSDIAELAAELAVRLLEESASKFAADIALAQLAEQIKNLPSEEGDCLKGTLKADGAQLVVVTATSMSPEDQSRWRQRLAAFFGQPDCIDFSADTAIGGGAELRMPHTVLSFTWRDQVARARELLLDNENPS